MSINWKKDVFTIPNLLSALRLALIPCYMSLYLHAQAPRDFYLAGGILAVSCLTDLADGFIARTFHMTSRLGRILDPLADKVTQFTLILCLSIRHIPLQSVLYLLVVKEVLQLLTSLLYLRRGKVLEGAQPAGKVCTAVLFSSLTFLVLFPQVEPEAVRFIAGMDTALLLISFASYLLAFRDLKE